MNTAEVQAFWKIFGLKLSMGGMIYSFHLMYVKKFMIWIIYFEHEIYHEKKKEKKLLPKFAQSN